MRKRDVIESVAEATGVKKTDVRVTLDAALELVRERLEAGSDVNLPPLGRIKVRTRGEGGEASRNYKLVLRKKEE